VTDNTPVDPKNLRVSDAEREHVVEVLQKAIGHGLISLDEFSDRTDTALAAKTRGELNSVLVDLPGLLHAENAPAPKAPPQIELRSTMSSLKRSGPWVVPQRLLIRSRMGSTELDFTEAVINTQQVEIELDVAGGSVELLFAENAGVTSADVTMTMGSLKDKRPNENGTPRFVISGAVRAGSVEIRRPKYVRIGAMVLRFPWKVTWER
jgi:Domain of unknown function (DUF1707)